MFDWSWFRKFRKFCIPSEDYAYNFVQWQIGVGSMWSEAIGVAPLKDTFHSTHVQPEAATDGDVPGDILNEHYPDLHSAVSLFSKGTELPRILLVVRTYVEQTDEFLKRSVCPW